MEGSKYQWWSEDGDTAATQIFSLLRHWDTEQSFTAQAHLRHFRLYSGRDLSSLSVSKYLDTQSGDIASAAGLGIFNNEISLNVVQSAIDALTAKASKQDIKPTFSTSGGVLEQRNRAQKLNKAIYGVFKGGGAYQAAPRVFKNCCIFGNGYLYPYYDAFKKKICFEAIFPDEIAVDPAAGYYGEPRELYRRKFVSRSGLEEKYPDLAAKISMVKEINSVSQTFQQRDTVMAVEAWRLPGPNAPGKHVLCLDGVMLVDEEYKRHRFPMAIMRYQRLPIGFHAIGVSEILRGIQVEINYTINRIKEQMRKVCKPWIFVEKGSQVDPNHMDNDIGSVTEYVGRPPLIQMAQTVAPEQFRHLQDLYNKAFEIVGVTQLSAQGAKPAGLDAAVALREYHDIETERFAEVMRAYEQMHVDAAYICCDIMDELGDGYTISSHTKDNGLEVLKWGDIRLPRDQYMIHNFPMSALPQQPNAKMQRVFELLNAGMIEPQIALDLLDFPDLDAWGKVQLAPVRIIYKSLEKMLFEDVGYIQPEPYFDLTLGVKYGMGFYNWAKLNDVPDDKLDLIRQWIDDCNAMIQEAQTPSPSAPAEIAQQQQLNAPAEQMPAEIGPQMPM